MKVPVRPTPSLSKCQKVRIERMYKLSVTPIAVKTGYILLDIAVKHQVASLLGPLLLHTINRKVLNNSNSKKLSQLEVY